MHYIFILFFVSFTIYILFLTINIISFLLYRPNTKNHTSNLSVSVIVAIRNGQESLDRLIRALLDQDYNGEFEFILVDDQSTDKTKEIIQNAQQKHPKIKYVSSNEGDSKLSFKKRALDAGISKSKYEILLFTDVDCKMERSWIKAMAESFDQDTDYVIGFSRAQKVFGLANLFQRIDFLMLMFSAKAVSKIGWPLACSGQNQAYKKSLFNKVGRYKNISHLLMGDDSIFLQLCLKFGAKVKFCSNPDSYIFCRPERFWGNLFFQRMRWAGDGNIMWKYNILFYLVMVSTVLSNLFIFFLILRYSFYILFIVLIIKLIFEIALSILGSIHFKEKISIFDFIYWYMLNVPYICIMSTSSFFAGFLSWKNRGQ